MHVVLDRLPRCFGRGAKQRTDIDIEPQIGEGAGNYLLPAVVAILAHFGHHNPRPATFGLFELLNQSANLVRHAHPPDFGGIHSPHRLHRRFVAPDTPSPKRR